MPEQQIRTSASHPLEVSVIDLPSIFFEYPRIGKIGFCMCPGKKGPSSQGGMWDRDIYVDLDKIVNDFAPECVINLMPSDELKHFGLVAPPFSDRRNTSKFYDFPIIEATYPQADATDLIRDCIRSLRNGNNVLFYDRGGVGRSATMVAMVLMELGLDNSAAISAIREAHPKAIEKANQEPSLQEYTAERIPHHLFCGGCVTHIAYIWNMIAPYPYHSSMWHAMSALFEIFEHHISAIGGEVDLIAATLGETSGVKFPDDFTDWHDTIPGGHGSIPPIPIPLIKWWQSVSGIGGDYWRNGDTTITIPLIDVPELPDHAKLFDKMRYGGAVQKPWHTLTPPQKEVVRRATRHIGTHFDDFWYKIVELWDRFPPFEKSVLLEDYVTRYYSGWARLSGHWDGAQGHQGQLSANVLGNFPKNQFWNFFGTDLRLKLQKLPDYLSEGVFRAPSWKLP